MRRGRPIAVGIALAAAGWGAPAAADPQSVRQEARLVYATDDEAACPTESQVAAAVAERLGYVPFRAGATRTVMMNVRRQGGGWHGVVESIDGGAVRGRRELQSDSACADLVGSLALSVALLLEPDAEGHPPRTPNVPPANTPPVAEAAPEPATTRDPADDPFVERALPVPKPSAERPRAWTVGLFGAGSIGSQPSPAPAGGAFADVRFEAVRLGLEGRVDLPTSTAPVTDIEVRVGLAQGALVPCFVRGFAAVCAVAAVGALSAEGQGRGVVARRETSLYAAFGGRFEATLPLALGPIDLRVYGDLVAPLTHPTFVVSDTKLWTLPPIAGALGLRVGLRLP